MARKKQTGINNPNIPADFKAMTPEQLPDLITLDSINPKFGQKHRFRRKYGDAVEKMMDDVYVATKETEKRIRIAKRVQNAKRTGLMKEAMQQAKETLLGTMSDTEIMQQAVTEVMADAVEPAKDDRSPDVLFAPNDGPQTDFLASGEVEVLYGGARGGGKTYGMMVAPLRFCQFGIARALILRRSMPELRDIIYKAQLIYPKAFRGCRFAVKEQTFFFPSGARIEFGFAGTRDDWMRYQGQSYTWIGIDEAAQFNDLDEMLETLRACLRSTDPVNVPAQLRLTANPGNVSSDVLKKQFIDKAPAGVTFFDEVELPDGTTDKVSRKFIAAKVTDNPYLMKDKSYLRTLAALSPVKRKQWLEGSWDVVEGAAFPEFDRGYHVVTPFEIPHEWPRIRGMDWGYKTPGCCLWGAVSPEKDIYIYREYYFTLQTAHEAAQRIQALEMGERIQFGVLDVSAWARRGETGPSIGETLNNYALRFRPSSRVFSQNKSARVAGAMQIHNMLAINPNTGKPSMYIFENCLNLIRTLPGLPISQHNPEDIDTDAEDHAYDALRYMLQSRMVAPSAYTQDQWALPDMSMNQQRVIVDPLLGF